MCEKKKKCICNQCEFHDAKTDNCKTRDVKECNKQEIMECKDFLVKDKLVHF